MHATVKLAKEHGMNVGASKAFLDMEGMPGAVAVAKAEREAVEPSIDQPGE